MNLENLMLQASILGEASQERGDYAITALMFSAPFCILGIALYSGTKLAEYLNMREYKKNPSLLERPEFKL